MLFKLDIRPEPLDVYYDAILLENVNQYIYLGVKISSNGKFFQAQKHLSEQASKALLRLEIYLTAKCCV